MWGAPRLEQRGAAPELELRLLVELHVVLCAERPLLPLRAEAIVQTPSSRHPVGMIVRAMMPRILAHGVATEAEIDVDTLDQRLAEECAKAHATYIGDMAFGAWARLPRASP